MPKRKPLFLRIDEDLKRQMEHAQVDSKHPSINAWVEEAIKEKLEREKK